MGLPASNAAIRGVKCPNVLHEEAMRILAGNRRLTYESHEFSVPAPVTDWSIVSDLDHVASCSCGRADGFGGIITRAGRIAMRNTGVAALKFKYNSTLEDPVTLEDGEKHDWDFTEVTDILFTTSGGFAVTMRVLAA